jgi:hypothetical protein
MWSLPFLNTGKDGAKRESLGRMVSSSTILLMVCIGTLILSLAFLILFHENANATNGYKLRNLEQDRAVLLLEQEVLNMEVAQAQALQNLNDDPKVKSMLLPKSVRYADTAALTKSSESSSAASSVASSVSSSVSSGSGSRSSTR